MLIEQNDKLLCFFIFGQTSKDALESSSELYTDHSVGVERCVTLCNPLPTGDHWKVIGWVLDYIRKGPTTLNKLSQQRREFIKHAADALNSDKDVCFEIVSKAARNYRDNNELRMQRGKVYVVFKKK